MKSTNILLQCVRCRLNFFANFMSMHLIYIDLYFIWTMQLLPCPNLIVDRYINSFKRTKTLKSKAILSSVTFLRENSSPVTIILMLNNVYFPSIKCQQVSLATGGFSLFNQETNESVRAPHINIPYTKKGLPMVNE